jgi:hypothetical protein
VCSLVRGLELATAWAEVVAHDRCRFEVPDPIGFADGGPGGAGWRGGPWAACGRVALPVPVDRPGGGTRVLAVLDPGVHARYRVLVARVAPAVERALGPGVAANRCQLGRGAIGLRLEPWRRARRRHDRLVRSLAAGVRGRDSDGTLLRADVRRCYGSIGAGVVAEALRSVGADREDVVGLGLLLERFEADGIPGLPVGPEPSAVLANAVLAAVDRALSVEGIRFVRWVDDVVARAPGGDWAGALEAFRASLAGIGLRPAEEKCGPGGVEPGGRPARSGRRLAPVPTSAPVTDSGDAWDDAMTDGDPFGARVALARATDDGSRAGRALLRHARHRLPDLAATVDWGLAR